MLSKERLDAEEEFEKRAREEEEFWSHCQRERHGRQPQQRRQEGKGLDPTSSSPASRRYKCPKCEKSFSQSYSMYRHYRYECDSLPRYQCPYCGHTSKWTHSIYNHIRKIHPGQEVTLNKLY
ncbi:hypothetical protein KM043_007659 [Ampulex compressa]|nr:hypothetical protein KM043_007659 [Ampulex compressa]